MECSCLTAGPTRPSLTVSIVSFSPTSVGLSCQSFPGGHISHGMSVLILLVLCTFSVSYHWDREQRGHDQMSRHLPEAQASYSSTLMCQNLLFQARVHGVIYTWNFLCVVELASSFREQLPQRILHWYHRGTLPKVLVVPLGLEDLFSQLLEDGCLTIHICQPHWGCLS